MKRTPLTRKTPLRARTPLTSTKPLTRTAPARRARAADTAHDTAPGAAERAPRTRRAPRRAPRHTGPDAHTRQLVIMRDGGRCLRCGRPGSNVHHRLGRGMGGAKGERSEQINRPAWLVTLCGQGNTSGCHRWVDEHRDQAVALGYVIPRNGPDRDAEDVPIRTLHRGWVLLDNEGGVTPCRAA